MEPLKDYTYNNKSISLLNTNENNNTNKYLLTIIDEKHYSTIPTTISCSITDMYDKNATGDVKFVIENGYTNKQVQAPLINGVAIIVDNIITKNKYQHLHLRGIEKCKGG